MRLRFGRRYKAAHVAEVLNSEQTFEQQPTFAQKCGPGRCLILRRGERRPKDYGKCSKLMIESSVQTTENFCMSGQTISGYRLKCCWYGLCSLQVKASCTLKERQTFALIVRPSYFFAALFRARFRVLPPLFCFFFSTGSFGTETTARKSRSNFSNGVPSGAGSAGAGFKASMTAPLAVSVSSKKGDESFEVTRRLRLRKAFSQGA